MKDPMDGQWKETGRKSNLNNFLGLVVIYTWEGKKHLGCGGDQGSALHF